jgi:predicted ribosome quality control (RQC) complex YloA/Tae2 family protein
MDGLSFHKILRILSERLAGATLNRITVLSTQLYLSFYKKGHFAFTFRSNQPPVLMCADMPAGETPGVLAEMNGASFVGLGSRLYDRVGWLDFDKRRPSGKLVRYRLVLEPMGGYANAFLLNGEGKILYRLTARSIDPDRDISTGKTYAEPKANKRHTLAEPGEAESFADLVGFYPATSALADEYARELGFSAAVERIRTLLETDDFFYPGAKGALLPFPPLHYDGEKIPFDSYDLKAKGSSESSADDALKKRIIRFYEKQQNHYTKLIEKIEQELSAAQNFGETRREADLLKNNIAEIKGKGTYKLVDYSGVMPCTRNYEYQADEPVAAHMRKLYKKAAKLERSLPMLAKRLTEAEQMRDYSAEQLYYAASADMQELKDMAELMKPERASRPRKEKQAPFLEFSIGESRIYLGRNSAQNHRLVFQFAIATDIWLHARQIPSAHCILRTSGQATEEEINYAASLVAKFSRNRNEDKVPVDYTLRKYVKKPKNTPEGFVTYSNFSTILVKPAVLSE